MDKVILIGIVAVYVGLQIYLAVQKALLKRDIKRFTGKFIKEMSEGKHIGV